MIQVDLKEITVFWGNSWVNSAKETLERIKKSGKRTT